MEVSGQLHSPAGLTPRETPRGNNCVRGWMSPRTGLNVIENKKYLATIGNRTPAFRHPARNPVSIPTASKATNVEP
jgi:hypothetical protein